MRVTKLIREYVEESVKAVYEPKIEAIGAEYYARKKALNEQLDAFIAQSDETVKKMIADAGFEIHYGRSYYIEVCIEELENECKAKRNALHIEMREKINDILVDLELGTTRAEIDEMIRNLK